MSVVSMNKFDECYVCCRRSDEINAGQNFQAIGHLVEQAECIHAVCLLCIQEETRVRATAANRLPSMRQFCGLCRSSMSNSGERGVQGRLFTVHPVVEEVEGSSQFFGQITSSEEMPADPNPLRSFDRQRADEAERIRRAARSNIEVVAETIGRELVGRVVSFAAAFVVGGILGAGYYSSIAVIGNELHPELDVFVPRRELNGLSPAAVLMLAGGIIGGSISGCMALINNPCGNSMEKAGSLVGKAIVGGLAGLNNQIERINRAWADAAQQPIG